MSEVMTMDAVVRGEECVVSPTPQWVARELSYLSAAEKGDRFFCIIRRPDDQLNVLREPDGFVLEWYLVNRGGALAAYRRDEGITHQAVTKTGFFASLFSKKMPVVGSRLTMTEAAEVLNGYVDGRSDFQNLIWKAIYL